MFAVALSPDGNILATAGRSPVVRLWNARTGERIRNPRAGHRASLEVEFSPDGRRLAASGYTGTVTLLDVATGTLEARLDDRVPGASSPGRQTAPTSPPMESGC